MKFMTKNHGSNFSSKMRCLKFRIFGRGYIYIYIYIYIFWEVLCRRMELFYNTLAHLSKSSRSLTLHSIKTSYITISIGRVSRHSKRKWNIGMYGHKEILNKVGVNVAIQFLKYKIQTRYNENLTRFVRFSKYVYL